MRRLLGCSIRHLLPLSIKLISLLIIHVFHTLCLLVFCFQDDISLNVDFKAIRTAWKEHQNICSWVFSGKRWFRHCFIEKFKKFKPPKIWLVLQTSSNNALHQRWLNGCVCSQQEQILALQCAGLCYRSNHLKWNIGKVKSSQGEWKDELTG